MEVSARYDNLAGCKSQYQQSQNAANGYGTSSVCTVTLGPLPKDASPPLFVYYQLDKAFYNHARMVKGRSDSQLRGDDGADTSTCEPVRYAGATLNQTVNPCGLAAWSYFNDSFSLSRSTGSSLTVSSNGIAFEVDLKKRFASTQLPVHFNDVAATRGGGQLSPAASRQPPHGGVHADERFIVWMRTPALPEFRKLWGRIDTLPDGAALLKRGEYITVAVDNNWNSYSFGGSKRIVLSTSTWLGGANDFLGAAYIVVGCVCLALGVAFSVLVALKGRKAGDPRFLSWNKKQAVREAQEQAVRAAAAASPQ